MAAIFDLSMEKNGVNMSRTLPSPTSIGDGNTVTLFLDLQGFTCSSIQSAAAITINPNQ
jgi:hypothetical protein